MLWLIVAAVLGLAVYVVILFNRLVQDRNLVGQAFADIDVQLKRRADLVPRLVEVVRGYAQHERATLLAVTELRTQAAARAERARGPDAQRFAAEIGLGKALHQLVVLQESYPALKADENFRQLSAQLVEVEDHLQYARRFYNGAVQQYATRIQTFPDLVVARLFAFKPAALFSTDDRSAVQVQL